MASLFRRDSEGVPRAALDLERGERVLASGRTVSGDPVVATERRLFLPTPDGLRSISWDGVDRARWNAEEEALVVIETAAGSGRPRTHRVSLERNVRLLDVIREQVTASVVLSRHVPVDARRGVRVTARRRPGGDGLRWVVAADAGLDIDHPEVRARIEAAVDAVRAEVE